MRKSAIFIAAALVTALALTGCSGGTSGTGGEHNTITAGKLTVCSDIPYKPFEYEDASAPTGYTGFDIDLMTAIAKQLGLELVVIVSDFDALQSGMALAAGQCDVGASAMTITDDRKAHIDFSDPYYDSLQSLLVSVESGITDLTMLAGKRIGVQTGTTGEKFAKENAPSDSAIVSFTDDGAMWLALQARQVDALLQDIPINMDHAETDPAYKVVQQWQTDEQYGFAMTKDKNPALRDAINSALAAVRASGEYDTIYNKYFG